MLTKQKLRLRVISAVLCATFLAQELHAAPLALDLGASALPPQQQLLQRPEAIEVPLDFAQLTEVHKGSKDVFIIHIQDAHSNVSGQQNLASTLEALMDKYQIRLSHFKQLMGLNWASYTEKDGLYTFSDSCTFDMYTQEFIFPAKYEAEDFEVRLIAIPESCLSEQADEVMLHINVTDAEPDAPNIPQS